MNIALATANDYEYTCVTMESIMQTLDTKINCNFFVLAPNDLHDNARQAMIKLEEIYENCKITFFNMGNEFDNAELHVPHISKPTYYRLILPELLEEEEKCLYLDTDIIVCKDISQLYDIDIDGYMVAGVKAIGYHCLQDQGKYYCELNHLESIDQYINAGVLLMNLSEMRKEELTKKALQMISLPLTSQDQDIINILCYNKIKFLTLKFNAMTKYYNWSIDQYNNICTQKEIEEAWANPVLIHYADAYKPWNDLDCPLSERWWAVCKNTNEWEYFYNKMQSEFLYRSIFRHNTTLNLHHFKSNILDKIDYADTVIVYGAGLTARKLISYLNGYHYNVKYIAVTQINENQQLINDIPVYSITELARYSRNAFVIVATQEKFHAEIIDILTGYHFYNYSLVFDHWF